MRKLYGLTILSIPTDYIQGPSSAYKVKSAGSPFVGAARCEMTGLSSNGRGAAGAVAFGA